MDERVPNSNLVCLFVFVFTPGEAEVFSLLVDISWSWSHFSTNLLVSFVRGRKDGGASWSS